MSNTTNNKLFEQIKNLIEQVKQNIAISVNSSLTMIYWEIGNKINQDIFKNQRAKYAKEIVVTLSRQLQDNMKNGAIFFLKKNDKNKVFIVHGYDNFIKEEVL
jgi:predicted nucleotide-binding protein